jgi:hypothetical protein
MQRVKLHACANLGLKKLMLAQRLIHFFFLDPRAAHMSTHMPHRRCPSVRGISVVSQYYISDILMIVFPIM